MNTAQLSQRAPNFLHDVRPPITAVPIQPVTPVQAQLVHDLPVKDPEVPTAAFKPIMSVEHQETEVHGSTAPGQVQHEATTAAHAQPVTQIKAVPAAPRTRKPVFETVLLIAVCISACAAAVLLLGS